MNKLEMQYKRETGNSATIGFEAPVFMNNRIGFKCYNLDAAIDEHFDLSDGILELPTADYIKWLEEKAEQQINNQ